MRRLQQLYSLVMGSEQSTKSNIKKSNIPTKPFDLPLVGLQNRTNTICYANSILQVLYYNTSFRQLILSEKQSINGIMYYMNDLYTSISSKNDIGNKKETDKYNDNEKQNRRQKNIVTAKRLMNYIQQKNEMFQLDYHQDCHQFFIWLINEINDQFIKRIRRNKPGSSLRDTPTVLEKELFGIQTTRIVCSKCKTTTQTDELQVDLSLHLPLDNTTLSDCIKSYSRKQHLKEQNKFFCNKCRSLQNAQKSILLKTLPKFKYNSSIKGLSKISSQVSFPLQLKIKANYDPNSRSEYYNLYGIVVHMGQGTKYGHYIAIIKINNQWIEFNDDQIHLIDQSLIQKLFGGKGTSMCAYMLFYQKV